MPELLRVPLDGVPAGLVALAPAGPDGALPRDRRGRAAPKKAVLAARRDAAGAVPGTDPGLLPEPEWRWATAVPSRRWGTFAARFGDRAWDTAVALARAGVVTVHCAVEGVRPGAPSRIELTAPWAAFCLQRQYDRTAAAARLRDHAQVLAGNVRDVDSGLADALADARGHEPAALPVLVAAAEDLLAGAVHDGPRAFSQAHFGDTKARDDAPAILIGAGASPRTLGALGLVRSPYLGLGGAVGVTGASGTTTDLRAFPGPVQFRIGTDPFHAQLLDDHGPIELAVVENLQAAETVCDSHGTALAVAWCAGQPADRPLNIIAALAARASRVLIATDADWGGVRIAARVADAIPAGVPVEVLDAGAASHKPREPFSQRLRDNLRLLQLATPHAQIHEFSTAVLDRGYPVEQEASLRAVLSHALEGSA